MNSKEAVKHVLLLQNALDNSSNSRNAKRLGENKQIKRRRTHHGQLVGAAMVYGPPQSSYGDHWLCCSPISLPLLLPGSSWPTVLATIWPRWDVFGIFNYLL